MTQFFTRDYMILWTLLLALCLYLPVRQLIWVLYVRRAQNKNANIEDAERARLRNRAGVTAGLLCLLFSYFYVAHLFAS